MKDVVIPEHIVELGSGATPLQIVLLVLLGIIALSAIFIVVRWIVDLKLGVIEQKTGTLPEDIKTINAKLGNMEIKLTEIKGQLWSHDDVTREIDAAIGHHVSQCPYHCGNNNRSIK